MKKVKRITSVEIPRQITLLSGNMYYDSRNGAHIHVNNLEAYIKGEKYTEVTNTAKPKSNSITNLIPKDVSDRWDLNY